MPAMSESQRRFLNARKGHEWVKRHGFDNKGELPEKVKGKNKRAAKRRVRKHKAY